MHNICFDVYVLIYGLGNPSEITFEIAREGGFIGPLKTFEKKNIIDAQNDYGPNGVFYKISDSDDTYTFVGQRFLGIKMIEGSKSAKLDKNKVFYLKSRGFNQSDIYKILFKSISSKGFCHFQADGDFAYLIDGAKRGIDPNFMIKIQNHRDNLPTIKFNAIC